MSQSLEVFKVVIDGFRLGITGGRCMGCWWSCPPTSGEPGGIEAFKKVL